MKKKIIHLRRKKIRTKKNSEKRNRIIAVSGGFDPVHVGHVRMFHAAKKIGNELVVILNNDHWLRAKKGYAFMPDGQRKEILEALRVVDRVVITDHFPNDTDVSVVRALKKIRPHIFGNGGDRKNERDIPEAIFCKENGIEMVFNLGVGGKIASSSHLATSAAKTLKHSRTSKKPSRRS